MTAFGQLRVWHIPQVPGKAFRVEVKNLEEAKLVLSTLILYDAFQYKNRIKPDYCNASGLEEFQDLGDGESDWCEWENEDGENIAFEEL